MGGQTGHGSHPPGPKVHLTHPQRISQKREKTTTTASSQVGGICFSVFRFFWSFLLIIIIFLLIN